MYTSSEIMVDGLYVQDDSLLLTRSIRITKPNGNYIPTVQVALIFISKIHPKVLAVEKSLEIIRESMEGAPSGIINVQSIQSRLDKKVWLYN